MSFLDVLYFIIPSSAFYSLIALTSSLTYLALIIIIIIIKTRVFV